MAESKLLIWNMALGLLKNTNSIEEENENSLEAKQCRIYYPTALGFVQRDHLWGFAQKHDTLSLTGTAPSGWAYQYKYPTDCMRASHIYNPVDPQDILDDRLPYRVAQNPAGTGMVIWTDVPDAELIYSRDVTDTTFWTPDFDMSLAFYLAHLLAFSLANNAQRASDMLNLYYASINRAQTNNTREGEKKPDRDSDWIKDRA